MTTRDAIRAVHFWLDQYADWFVDGDVCRALNRAVTEWVMQCYGSGIVTEKDRADLIGLTPVPLEGTGSRVVVTADQAVYLVLAIDLYWKDADGVLGLPVPCQPVSRDAAAKALRSVFRRPTYESPLYVSQKQTGGIGQVFDILAPAPPDKWRLHYIKRPTPLSVDSPDTEWSELPDWGQQAAIQSAKRMLLAAMTPGYDAQIQVEEPLATGAGNGPKIQ